MANFKRGSAAITEAAERRGQGRFTPTHVWKDSGEKKYIQFLTTLEEVPTVDYHGFITVGYTDDGKALYQNFISRQDEGVDGASGYDPIKDRFGLNPTPRSIALAVELKARTENVGGRNKIVGFDVAKRTFEKRDGSMASVPAIGYIIQSPGNFFGWLTTFNEDKPIEEHVFKITRRGKGADTSYDFIEAGDAIELELDEDVVPDLDAFLEELSDEKRVHKYIDPLPDDFVLNKWAKLREEERKKAKDNKDWASTLPKREVEEEPPTSDRRSKFNEFRDRVAQK